MLSQEAQKNLKEIRGVIKELRQEKKPSMELIILDRLTEILIKEAGGG